MIYLKKNTDPQTINIPRNNVIEFEKNPFSSLSKVDDYLYEVTYKNIDYKYAEDYFEHRAPVIPGACSCVVANNLVGRKYDWFDNYEPTFTIHTSHNYKVVGTASVAGLTIDVVDSGHYDEKYKILPFFLQDGVNEKGLFCEVNVVPLGDTAQTIPTSEKTGRVCSVALVRYILDHYDSVDYAISDLTQHIEIFLPQGLIDMGYSTHYVLADANKSVVLELVDNGIAVIDSNISTNFHLNGVEFADDGSIYTPVTAAEGQFPSAQGVEQYGSGLERYNVLKQAQIEDIDDMRNVMQSLNYSNAYTLPTGDTFWYSEFVGTTISVDTPYNNSDFEARIAEYKRKWEEHTKATGDCWITCHTTICDIPTKTIWVSVQESPIEHKFNL